MSETLPMFPLGTVLLPGSVLPLHIFEERYRRLVRACLAGDRRFGVTLIARGSEVGGGDSRTGVGVVATIVEEVEFDDGRWAIAVLGTDRVRVLRWLADDPYPSAEVELWADAPSSPVSRSRITVIAELLGEVTSMSIALGEQVAQVPDRLPADPTGLSYALLASSPLGTSDRFDLLCTDGADQRLIALEQRLLDHRVLLGARLAMRSE